MTKRILQQIGSKGGKATASKRTPEQRSEAARKAARSRWPIPSLDTFEVMLCGHWFTSGDRGGGERPFWDTHWISPLVKAGYAAHDRNEPKQGYTEIYYRPTPEGLAWWINQRSNEDRYRNGDPAMLAELFEGQGIGNTITLDRYWFRPGAAFAILKRGLADFVGIEGHAWSPGFGHGHKLFVRLNKAGYEYFGSLPKIDYDLNC